jgi:two-component system nitrate/nitrite response regulator NarL
MTTQARSPGTIARVLLIDPYPISLIGLERILAKDSHFQVCGSTSSTKKGIQLAKQLNPDVIVVDPQLDEVENLKLLTELQAQSSAKILILTNSSNPRILDQAVLLGARGTFSRMEPVETLAKAIACIGQGELWLNRQSTTRILSQMTKQAEPKEHSAQESQLQSLTKQEDRICRTIQGAATKTLKEIAITLNISEHTLRNHLVAIYHKLGVRNRMDLYVFCNKYQKTKEPHLHPRRRASDI